MRVLIVSPSYLPEIGAAPSRITNMAEGLSGLGIKVDVLTCLPNYPKGRIFDGYRGAFSKTEDVNGITVFRYWTYASISRRPLVRLASMCAFATTLWCFALKRKRIKSYDKVIIQTPPVLAAASAMLLFRCCYRKKVVLNVSDLWPLSAVELGAMKEGGVYHGVMGRIERFLYRKATACQGQSKEIVDYIKRYEPGKASFLYRNLQHRFVLPNHPPSSRKPFRIVYAGLLGVALGPILLPSLSKSFASGNHDEYNRLMDWGLRLCFLLALPSAVALGILSGPLTVSLFQYGKFTAFDALMTQRALIAYSVGLIGLIVVKVLAPGFYSRQDIKTPVKIAIVTLILTQLMNLAFIGPLKHAGLSLSIGLAASLNASLLYWQLRKQKIFTPQPGWMAFLLRLVVAVLVMSGVLLGMLHIMPEWSLGTMPWRLLRLMAVVLAGIAAYFAALAVLGFKVKEFARRTV